MINACAVCGNKCSRKPMSSVGFFWTRMGFVGSRCAASHSLAIACRVDGVASAWSCGHVYAAAAPPSSGALANATARAELARSGRWRARGGALGGGSCYRAAVLCSLVWLLNPGSVSYGFWRRRDLISVPVGTVCLIESNETSLHRKRHERSGAAAQKK